VPSQSQHKNINRARAFRRRQTPAEARLWSRLRNGNLMGVKFRRQVPIGPYVVDFASRTARVIVEAGGGQHADTEEEDQRRTEFLESRGYTVLRFWNRYILKETDAIMEVIGEAVHWGVHPDNPLNRP
jgi:very-short-patch-repair endonuclease